MKINFVYTMKERWNPEHYHENSEAQKGRGLQTLSRLKFIGNERVLDIGCGDGKITVEIAKQVQNGSVVGVDLSKSMIDFASNKFLKSDYANLEFLQADATKLSFENEFDIIVSFACLSWIQDQLSVLAGIKKALKPHGKALLRLMAEHERPLNQAIEEVASNDKWQNYFIDFEPDWNPQNPVIFKDNLSKVGLEITEFALTNKFATYNNEKELQQWLAGWVPHLQRLTNEMSEIFLEQVIKRYLELQPTIDGKIIIPSHSIEVECTNKDLN